MSTHTTKCVDCGTLVWWGSVRCRACYVKVSSYENSKHNEARRIKQQKKCPDLVRLRYLYEHDQYATRTLADMFHVSRIIIMRWLRESGVALRSCQQSKWTDRHRMIRKLRRPRWQGGIIKDHGYIRVQQLNHLRADQQGYVPQHILVMEETLGRPLKDGELVHHINRHRSDNHITNLAICSNLRGHGWCHSSDSKIFFGI